MKMFILADLKTLEYNLFSSSFLERILLNRLLPTTTPIFRIEGLFVCFLWLGFNGPATHYWSYRAGVYLCDMYGLWMSGFGGLLPPTPSGSRRILPRAYTG